MKRTLLILLSIGFIGLGSLVVVWPRTPVTVMIINKSNRAIASVRVEHEGGIELVEHLNQRESKIVRFEARGETSYKLRVRFLDGSEVRGGGGYAEPGYKFSETIWDSQIETDVSLPRY